MTQKLSLALATEAWTAASLKRLPARTMCGKAKPMATIARQDSHTVMPWSKQKAFRLYLVMDVHIYNIVGL